jgi:hypothetical protein
MAPWLRVVLCGLAAIVLLGWFGYESYVAWRLDRAGVVTQATVVSASSGARPNVTVHIGQPIDRDVDLLGWSGSPAVGSSLAVRYDPADPGRARDDRVGPPWVSIVSAFVAGVWFFVGAITAVYRARRHARVSRIAQPA